MMRIIVLMGGVVTVLVGIIYIVFIRQNIQLKELSIGRVTTVVPANWSMNRSRQKGWEMVRFHDGTSLLRFAWNTEKEAGQDYLDNIHRGLKGYAFYRRVRIYNDGYYYIFSEGKNSRRFLAIFTHRSVPWWIESRTQRSTHRIYKEVLDRALVHLRIDGEPVSPELASEIEAIDREIGIRYVQGDTFWLLFMFAPLLMTMGIMGLITWLGGRPARKDKFQEETIIREAPGTDVSMKGRGEYKLSTCCLYLTDKRLVAFGVRRPIMEIWHHEDADLEVTTGMSRFFGMPYLQIISAGQYGDNGNSLPLWQYGKILRCLPWPWGRKTQQNLEPLVFIY
jgi:hypothetical protein